MLYILYYCDVLDVIYRVLLFMYKMSYILNNISCTAIYVVRQF